MHSISKNLKQYRDKTFVFISRTIEICKECFSEGTFRPEMKIHHQSHLSNSHVYSHNTEVFPTESWLPLRFTPQNMERERAFHSVNSTKKYTTLNV